jgi:hypothetical protein
LEVAIRATTAEGRPNRTTQIQNEKGGETMRREGDKVALGGSSSLGEAQHVGPCGQAGAVPVSPRILALSLVRIRHGGRRLL